MSQFLNDPRKNDESFREEIDFEDAIRLPDGGTTCDIYRTRWQRREVFVKRLKEKYRTNPHYLDALDKEYEIGVSLKHPSLPDYREFHRDYIVMDFIDGSTLADMIKRQDPWLKSENNILRMLKELVDVVEYLHRHNVTHCDIKPDNIMITADNRNLFLIDFDKCYTDSLNDTSGDPSKYGLTSKEQGKIAIDFHGIGRVVKKLRESVNGFKFRKYKEFIKECESNECSSYRLLEILDYKYSENHKVPYLLSGVAIIVITVALFLWILPEKPQNTSYEPVADAKPLILKDTTPSANPPAPQEAPAPQQIQQKEDLPEIAKSSVSDIPPESVQLKEQLHSDAQEMASQLDKMIQPFYNKLNISLDHLEKLKSNPEVTKHQLLDSVRKHMDMEDEYNRETFEIMKETFPHITDREAWRILAYSKAYTGYTRRAGPLLKNYFN